MITAERLTYMCNARSRLQRELEPPPKVSVLARQAGLSTEHFIAQFRALFGQTPLQCRNRARLELAREALANTSESATQIALTLGFAAPGSLSRVFAQNMGVSPRTFRARTTPFAASPPSCVALMNTALGDLNFGEVDAALIGHDPASPSN